MIHLIDKLFRVWRGSIVLGVNKRESIINYTIGVAIVFLEFIDFVLVCDNSN